MGESKILDHLCDAERLGIVGLVEDFILSTDFGKHKHFMGQFEEMVASDHRLDMSKEVERHFILMVSICGLSLHKSFLPALKICF